MSSGAPSAHKAQRAARLRAVVKLSAAALLCHPRQTVGFVLFVCSFLL